MPDLSTIQSIQTIALIAGLVILFLAESFWPFYSFFKPIGKTRGLHLLRNLIMGVINAGVVAFLFVGLWFMASEWAYQNDFGLLNWLSISFEWPALARTVLALLLFDFWMYLWHRLNNVIPLFWRFHKVHHSDPNMDVSTASRFHQGEIALSSFFRIGIIMLLGIWLWELLLYETLMFGVVQFHHSNVKLPRKIDDLLKLIIVTPNMHRVHHSRWQPETDSNYSALFSVWDRIGRSFVVYEKPETIQLGLKGLDEEDSQSIKGMMKTPLDSE